ncbi:single-stranded DNA-binding protein [Sulfurovum sp.]|uniref:single-stranded DNA-binding protein n=1 Tax=Sulfurovum sp. TaxID=1969726 RepID=UPI002A366A50|nr:single-stranded DNA-binding protein [Sulfurovum sp.]MDD2450311.1 single-stranded DNA-binding protein [Sulfurovum sp.]MDY0401890.1 single-stranded DNA-binding protein [Sulfurovum sp.]
MFNKVIFAGNLTKDIEIRYTRSTNTPLAKGSIASTRKYTARDGSHKEEDTTWDNRQTS